MISYEEALARTLALFEPLDTETVPLTEAPGRVIAAPVAARRDQPPFPSSAMDGYAVTEDDARQGRSLRVIGDSVAGRRFPRTRRAWRGGTRLHGCPRPRRCRKGGRPGRRDSDGRDDED